MAKTNLGRVMPLPKGEYSASTPYEKLDIVTYQGAAYICKVACSGVAPTDTSKWQLMAEKGSKGDKGDQGIQGIQGIAGPSGAHVDDLVIEQSTGAATDKVMSQNAVSQELSQLALKITDIEDDVFKDLHGELQLLPFTLVDGKMINKADGGLLNSTANKATSFIDVSGFNKIKVVFNVQTSSSSDASSWFYDYNTKAIQGSVIIPNIGEKKGYEERVIDVPNGAKYFRSTIYNDFADKFFCKGISDKGRLEKLIDGKANKEYVDAKLENIPSQDDVSFVVKKVVTDDVSVIELESSDVTSGMMNNAGTIMTSSNAAYTKKIKVDEGNVIKVKAWTLSGEGKIYTDKGMRFVTAYDSQNNVLSSKGTSSAKTSYVVPDGVDFIVLTIQPIAGVYAHNEIEITRKDANITRYRTRDIKSASFRWRGNITGGSIVKLPYTNIRKDNQWSFSGRVINFNELSIGISNENSDSLKSPRLTISNTTLSIRSWSGKDFSTPHGLTIENDLGVTIINDETLHPKHIIVRSNGNSFDWVTDGNNNNLLWGEYSGCPSVLSNASSLVDCSFGVSIPDIHKPLWVFGDSWTSLYDERWTNQVISLGFNKFLLSGFAGEKTEEGLIALKELLKLDTPNTIVWCYGMNDEDTSTSVNPSWKSCYDELVTICSNLDIELILYTVPTAKTRNMNYKNAIVRASGHRYVDAVAAMGADENGNWIDGYVSDDGIHTTVKGAKALAARFLADVPELANN